MTGFKRTSLFHQMQCDLFPRKQKPDCVVGVGHIAPHEERHILLKPVVQFCFTYGVSRNFLYIFLYFKHQFPFFIASLVRFFNILNTISIFTFRSDVYFLKYLASLIFLLDPICIIGNKVEVKWS